MLDRFLSEFERLRTQGADPALEAVRTAILVEDVFGIVLSDDQIDPRTLGSSESLRELISGVEGSS